MKRNNKCVSVNIIKLYLTVQYKKNNKKENQIKSNKGKKTKLCMKTTSNTSYSLRALPRTVDINTYILFSRAF